MSSDKDIIGNGRSRGFDLSITKWGELMGKGWIRLHRKIQNHWLYQEKRKFSRFEAWIDLLLMVNHEDTKVVLGNEIIDVKRGQRITSIRQLCDRWGWSNTKVTKFLKLLEDDGMITVKNDTKKTLITIEKYDFYQSDENEKTTEKRRKNDRKTTQKHTNKNDKNEKNDIEREREREDETNPFRMFEENIRMLNAYERESLIAWCNDLGDELVMEAIKYSIQQGARTYKYLDYKLRRWVEKGVKDKNDAWVAEMELEEERKQKVVNLPNRKVGVGGIDWDNI